jgi:hypothetical protein
VPPDRECHTNLKQRVEPLRYPHFCNERAVRAAQGGTLLAPYSSAAAEQRTAAATAAAAGPSSSASYNSFIPPDQILPLALFSCCLHHQFNSCVCLCRQGDDLGAPPTTATPRTPRPKIPLAESRWHFNLSQFFPPCLLLYLFPFRTHTAVQRAGRVA